MAAFVLTVAALLWEASAQIYSGPILAQPLLPLTSCPVSQISQFVPVLSAFPIGGSVPTQAPTTVAELPTPTYYPSTNLLPTPIPTDIPDLPITSSPNLITNPMPVISTTVIDNTVANSLANVLQLLVVSELLESSFAPPPVNPFLSNYIPIYDAIGILGPVVSPLDVKAPLDVSAVSNGLVVDASTVVTDVITPVLPSVVDVTAPVASVTEVITPVTTFTQNVYAPVTDFVAPAPEIISPVISTVTEVSSSISAVPTADVYTTITDSISYYAPNYITEVTDVVAPFPVATSTPLSYISDYYSGYADVITSVPTTVPFTAELVLPKSIPAQIVCNFGYSPANGHVLNMNVEPLPYVF